MVVLVLRRGFYHLYRAAGGCDNLIWWQCWYLGWCWPQCCWQSWQRARCHCLLTVDGIIQVLTILTLLTLHHHHHYPLSSPASKIIHSQHLAIWPDQQAIRAQISHLIPLLSPSTIHIFIIFINMNRMGGGEYLGLTMKYLFGQETAHLMLDVATHR